MNTARNTPEILNETELLAQPAAAYMSPSQLAFFRRRLEAERQEVIARIEEGTQRLRDATESERISDQVDHASREEARLWTMRQMNRDRQLMHKINAALERINTEEYGWCEETGEPIGLRRLLLRPTTTLCIEAKQRQEQLERHGIRGPVYQGSAVPAFA